ncbi:MAG: DUF1566 domain-containing protein [Desulfobacterales bacterium]|nr:DUF1566 domain-containing protein [Desulfobacterales bacterium]
MQNRISNQWSKQEKSAWLTEGMRSNVIFLFFILQCIFLTPPDAIADNLLSGPSNENEEHGISAEPDDDLTDIVNPLKSTCYDWKGSLIPCEFKRPYAELLYDKPIPDPRFVDNKNGTVSDNLTGLIWLKNTRCFGMMDWKDARLAAKRLKHGDCGPDAALTLSDGSSAGDWRLPTMGELCTLIDYSKRNPALPDGHMFSDFPSGYFWSATTLDNNPGMAWIVYFESGTTCYDDIKNHAGHIWPVRGPKE